MGERGVERREIVEIERRLVLVGKRHRNLWSYLRALRSEKAIFYMLCQFKVKKLNRYQSKFKVNFMVHKVSVKTTLFPD